MDEKSIKGGAGPALAAHSKDASAPGINPASSATDENRPKSATDGMSATVDRIAGQARDAAGKAAISISTHADEAQEKLAQQDVTPEQARDFVRGKPLTALLAALGVGMVLGLLTPRR
ncbi:DUF883 C-terminal domain-containing protein [Acidisphaera sp. L21]|uniref:DUF883 C-terminal domain-containing protein n=1 Tax=Acidisphaera sp. L21 TaxID=1641851 RepID=UPI00131DD959|nr:DUF883 C-terminal domain-containing protein [Acidisphaera sp. L21]